MSKLRSGWWCVCVMMIGPLAWGQDHSNRPRELPNNALAISTVEVKFSRDERSPAIPASPALSFPIQCSEDGSIFVQLLKLPDLTDSDFVAIAKDSVNKFSTQWIRGLYGIQVRSYFAQDSGAILLVEATKDDHDRKRTTYVEGGKQFEETGKFGERHLFIATFRRDGQYEKALQLDDRLSVEQVAAFPTGEFLVVGTSKDSADQSLQWALLKSDGSLLRILEFPNLHEVSPSAPQKQTLPYYRPVQFFSFGGSLFVAGYGSPSRVAEVKASAEVRSHPISVPEGYTHKGFIPSASGWYARFSKPLADQPAGLPSLMQSVIYQINPPDGNLLRRIEPVEMDADSIACEHDGVFSALSRDANNNLIVLRGKF